MRFKTREMEFMKAFEEVLLQLCQIGLRVFQAVILIPVIGFVAAMISDFSKAEMNIPTKATAAVAVACVCTAYSAITILPIFFEGPLFFTSVAVLDVLFVTAWSTLVGLWDGDGTGTCHAFETKYFGELSKRSYFSTDCQLMKATFAFMIINL
jgi:hypothetical protein